MSPAIRQRVRVWHRWSALALAALLLTQALSGLMITFKDEAARLLQPGVMRSAAPGARIDPDRAFERAHAAAGDCKPERLYFPTHADGIFLLRCRTDAGALRLASVDAVTGRVLASGSLWAFPFEAADLLHLELTVGRVGRNIIGTVGLALAVIAAFGVAAWWPGWGKLIRALRVPWRGTARQKLVQVHRTGGAILSVLLLLVATAGAAVAFLPLLERALDPWLPIAKAPAFQSNLSGGTSLSLAEVERRALAQLPGDTVRDIRTVAGAPTDALVVLNPAQRLRPRAVDRVWIDRRDGRVVIAAAADEPTGSRVLGWILPVHTGEALGAAGRWLGFVVGLGLVGLVATGCTSWFLDWRRKRSPPQP